MVSNKEYAVIFVDVEEIYSYNHELVCKFVTNNYTPQDGDRVAMFKLGWKSVKDYIVFEWAPTGLPETVEHQVTFEKHDLPQNLTELYQICYISSENVLHGASLPFKFQSDIPKKGASLSDILHFSQCDVPLLLTSCEDVKRLRRIKKENEKNSDSRTMNRMSISYTEIKSDTHKDCKKEISDLKQVIQSLMKTIAIQENEINLLRSNKEGHKTSTSIGLKPNFLKDLNFDLGELESIPPFPLDL